MQSVLVAKIIDSKRLEAFRLIDVARNVFEYVVKCRSRRTGELFHKCTANECCSDRDDFELLAPIAKCLRIVLFVAIVDYLLV